MGAAWVGVNWSAVGLGALIAGAGLVVAVLVALALRTGEGRELAIAAGVRLVKVLLGWLEAWLTGQLVQAARGLLSGQVVEDTRLARVRQVRRLVREL